MHTATRQGQHAEGATIGPYTPGNAARHVADDLNAEGIGQQNGNVVRQVVDDQDNTRKAGTIGPHAHGNTVRHVVDDLNAEGNRQQKP